MAAMKAASEENVVPPGGANWKKPYRKMLNELKNENASKFAPTVTTCFPRNRLKLFVSCHTSWSRMLWIENGSCPIVVYVTPSPTSIVGKGLLNGWRKSRKRL